jgi:hypothetical protein
LQNQRTKRLPLNVKQRNWLKRKGEIIIDVGTDGEDEIAMEAYHRLNSGESAQLMQSKSVEEKVKYISEDTSTSISGMNLREISRAYGFSLNYLGDFISSQGISVVDIHKKLGDMMTGHDIYELLVALQSQDPMEVNDGYQGPTISQFAGNRGLDYEDLVVLCKEHNIPLPFGPITVLHRSMYEFLLPYVGG